MAAKPPSPNPAIEVENLTVSYGPSPALLDVSFAIEVANRQAHELMGMNLFKESGSILWSGQATCVFGTVYGMWMYDELRKGWQSVIDGLPQRDKEQMQDKVLENMVMKRADHTPNYPQSLMQLTQGVCDRIDDIISLPTRTAVGAMHKVSAFVSEALDLNAGNVKTKLKS